MVWGETVREGKSARGHRGKRCERSSQSRRPADSVRHLWVELLSIEVCGKSLRRNFFASIIKSETANRSFMFASSFSSSSSSSLLTARHFTSRQFSLFPSHLSALQKKVYYCIRWGVSPQPTKKGGRKRGQEERKGITAKTFFVFVFLFFWVGGLLKLRSCLRH